MGEEPSKPGGSSGSNMHTTGGGWRWTPPTPEELAVLLTGYGVERLLGHGGMGAVYKGVQLSLDREVAIKILPPGMAVEDPSYAARFRNEAKVMARLQHPGIVSVFESGETAEGQLYFVMEYVEGTDVQEMLRAAPGGRLAPAHALAICAHVCDALGYAHQNGVIHRDIKPANILINRDGQVKVADFGLGKVEEPGASGLTQAGMAMGTPDYVAPEALIPGSSVDGRADVYALGVMMYQMLTGRVPRGAFQPASVAVPGLDRRLDGVISQAMQMEREDRYQSTDEMRAELGPMLYGGTSAAELAGYSTSMIKRKAPGPGSGGASSRASAGSSASSGAGTGARPAVAATRPAPAVSAAGGATPAKVFTWVGLGAAAVALLLFLAFGLGGGKNGKEAKDGVVVAPKAAEERPQQAPQPPVLDQPVVAMGGSGDAGAGTSPWETGSVPESPLVEDPFLSQQEGQPGETASPDPEMVIEGGVDGENAGSPEGEVAVETGEDDVDGAEVVMSKELEALHRQVEALTEERVEAPFREDLEKLNAGYLGGLGREVGAAKGRGDLDGVIVLEAEVERVKGLIAAAGEGEAAVLVGAAGDAEAEPQPETLGRLWGIYSEAYAKLEAKKNGNQSALNAALVQRLQGLEGELTRADRIADARAVRDYRLALGVEVEVAVTPTVVAADTGTGETAAEQAVAGVTSADTEARLPFGGLPTGGPRPASQNDDRAAAEWVIGVGGSVKLEGVENRIHVVAHLPRSRVVVTEILFDFKDRKPSGDLGDLGPIEGLRHVRNLSLQKVDITPAMGRVIGTLTGLTHFEHTGAAIDGAALEHFGSLKELNFLSAWTLANPTLAGMQAIGSLRKLGTCNLHGGAHGMTGEMLGAAAAAPRLHTMWLSGIGLSAFRPNEIPVGAVFAKVTYLNMISSASHLPDQVEVMVRCFPALRKWELGQGHGQHPVWDRATLASLARLSELPDFRSLKITLRSINGDALEAFGEMKELGDLRVDVPGGESLVPALRRLRCPPELRTLHIAVLGGPMPAGGLAALAEVRDYKKLRISNEWNTRLEMAPAEIQAFRQARPDVELDLAQ